jgi:AraC-like DNA-binding protein/quercetin dioxygenase-like cupin family protein
MPSRAVDHAEVVAFTTSTQHNVEVMRTWYRAQAFARHTHPYFTLGLMRRGVGTLWSAGTTNTLRPGDIVLIPPGAVHTGGLDDRGGLLSYVAVHLPTDLVAAAAGCGPGPGAGEFETAIFTDAGFGSELRRVDAAIEAGGDQAEVESAIIAAINLLVDRQAGRDRRSDPGRRGIPRFVEVARAAIEDCYADGRRISLDALATVAGVSPFHLAREFKRASGLSPHQYVMQTRITRAAELLARGAPISDTAATVGFADQSHLTTQFKRFIGMTPASWQRSFPRR